VIRQRSFNRHRASALGLAVFGLLIAAPVHSQLEVPPDRQVLVLTRALSYDSDLKTRVGSDITLAVLSKAGNASSEASAATIMKAFRVLSNVKVQGLPLITRALSYTSGAALSGAVAAQGIDAIYVCPGLDSDLAAIIDVCRKRHVVSFASREEQVTRGLSLGVFPIDSRPTIVLNLPAAKSEGASFSSELLRVAKVLK
jgi:hypothetical protein